MLKSTSSLSPSIAALPPLAESLAREKGSSYSLRYIKTLPPEILHKITDEIKKNDEKIPYQSGKDLQNLGRALFSERFINRKPQEEPYEASEIYRDLINENILPPVFFHTVLAFFANINKLGMLEWALAMPDLSEEEIKYIIQRTCSIIPILEEKEHFEKLNNNLKDPRFNDKELGEILCKNIWNMPINLWEPILEKAKKIIERTEKNKLLLEAAPFTKLEDSLSDVDSIYEDTLSDLNNSLYEASINESEIEEVVKVEEVVKIVEKTLYALHENYKGIFIVQMIKERPFAIVYPEIFKVLASKLEDISYNDLSLIRQLLPECIFALAFNGRIENCNDIFNILQKKFDDFTADKRTILLETLISIVKYVDRDRDEHDEIAQWVVEKTEAIINAKDGSKRSNGVQILAQLAWRFNSFDTKESQESILKLFEKYLPTISDNEIAVVLEKFARLLPNLWLKKEIQIRSFNLIKEKLKQVFEDEYASIRFTRNQYSETLEEFANGFYGLYEEIKPNILEFLEKGALRLSDNGVSRILRQIASVYISYKEPDISNIFSLIKKNIVSIKDGEELTRILAWCAKALPNANKETRESIIEFIQGNVSYVPGNGLWSIFGEFAGKLNDVDEEIKIDIIKLLKIYISEVDRGEIKIPYYNDYLYIKHCLSEVEKKQNGNSF